MTAKNRANRQRWKSEAGPNQINREEDTKQELQPSKMPGQGGTREWGSPIIE